MADSSGFDKRLRAFEAGFAHEEKVEFRVLVRRNQKLGAWAAAQMGLAGEKAEIYASDLIEAAISQPGEDELVNKISQDFDARHVKCTARTIRRKMEDLMAQARQDIQQGIEPGD